MVEIIEKLKRGDRRSIGRTTEVVQDILDDPTLFETVFRATLHENPLVSMRAADVVDRVTALHPHFLQTHKALILEEIAQVQQSEVRWHVAQTLPKLDLNQEEVRMAIDILKTYLKDDSRILRTFAMNSLTFFAESDPTLEPWVIALIEEQIEDGTPAMQSRGRKLLARLKGIGRA